MTQPQAIPVTQDGQPLLHVCADGIMTQAELRHFYTEKNQEFIDAQYRITEGDGMKGREEFEAAYIEEMVRLIGKGVRLQAIKNTRFLLQNGEYQDPALRLAFWAWQAAPQADQADVSALIEALERTTKSIACIGDAAGNAVEMQAALAELFCAAKQSLQALQAHKGAKP